MPNYKSTTVQGESWNRWCRVMIENPLHMPEFSENGVPSLLAVEEEISPKANNKLSHDIVANLGCSFDTTTTYPKLNPLTNEVIGTTNHSNIYVEVYSLIMHLAAQRDAAQEVN